MGWTYFTQFVQTIRHYRLTMPVYRDYEIRINLNELIEQEMHVCDALHPDHCLTEDQIDHIAHALRSDLDLSPIYQQVHDEIARFCEKYHVEMP